MRKFILPAIAALSLTACNFNWNPSYMPAGYTYHHKDYKSSAGPDAPDIGYEYSDEHNNKNLDEWRYALRDLILKSRAQDLNLPQELNLKTDLADSVFQSSFDYILREGLREYGHTLSEDPNAPVVFYSAFDPEYDGLMIAPPSTRTYNGDMDTHENPDILKEKYNPEKVELILGILENNEIIRDVRGQYKLPLHGYKPGEYVHSYQNPLHKKGECPLTPAMCKDHDTP